jgi:hypothetical protein
MEPFIYNHVLHPELIRSFNNHIWDTIVKFSAIRHVPDTESNFPL